MVSNLERDVSGLHVALPQRRERRSASDLGAYIRRHAHRRSTSAIRRCSPIGRRVSLDYVGVMRVSDGKIAYLRDYFDEWS